MMPGNSGANRSHSARRGMISRIEIISFYPQGENRQRDQSACQINDVELQPTVLQSPRRIGYLHHGVASGFDDPFQHRLGNPFDPAGPLRERSARAALNSFE